jgi:hypothetical protein
MGRRVAVEAKKYKVGHAVVLNGKTIPHRSQPVTVHKWVAEMSTKPLFDF